MRIVSLDFLRFLAAFSVAVPHLVIYFSLYEKPVVLETVTALAVEIFFVLSGFVLCPFLEKIFQSTERVGKNLMVFLVRRWMRTLPLYFLSLATFIILFSGKWDLTAFKYLLFLQNFYWPPPELDYFSVSWSLAVEEWFYILFPAFMVLFFLVRGKTGPIKNRAGVFLLGSIAFVLVFTLLRVTSDVPAENWGTGIRRVVLFRIDSIVFGILLYLLRSHIYRIPIPVIVLAIAGTVVYLFSGYDRIHNGQSNPFEFRFLIFAAITLFSCAVLSLFLRLEDFFKKRLKKVSLWGGRISYGVYLFHIPVSALVGRFLDMTEIFFLLLSILAICGATTAIYHFFERPILNARPDFDFDEEPGPRPK